MVSARLRRGRIAFLMTPIAITYDTESNRCNNIHRVGDTYQTPFWLHHLCIGWHRHLKIMRKKKIFFGRINTTCQLRFLMFMSIKCVKPTKRTEAHFCSSQCQTNIFQLIIFCLSNTSNPFKILQL